MPDLTVAPAVPDAPKVESSPKRKHRIPLWLRWVIGIPLVLCAIVLLAMPPQRPVTLNGWTPGCPQLEAEAWREGTVQSAALGKIDDELKDAILDADWMHVGDALWLCSSKSWSLSGNVILTAPSATGSKELILERALVSEGSGRRFPQSEVWVDGDRVWMLVGTHEVALEKKWYLAAYDIATLTEVERVQLAMPPGATYQSSFLDLMRISTPVEQPWLFIVTMSVDARLGAPQDEDYCFLTEFDPRTSTFSPVVELHDPGPPIGSPAGAQYSFQVWTDQGRFPAWYAWETACWHVDATDYPSVQLIPSVNAAIPMPPVSSNVVNLSGGNGWSTKQEIARPNLPSGVSIVQEYQEFTLDHLVKATLQADFDRKTFQAQSKPQQTLMRRRMDLYSGAAPLLFEPDRQLHQHYQAGALRLQDTWMELPWTTDHVALSAEFDQSLRASLMHAQWLTGGQPFGTMPVLWLYPLDLDTTLVMQLVVSDKGAAGHPAGVLRIGRLAAPATSIDWLGYAPLPESFAEYRHRYRIATYAESDGWVVGLTALKPEGTDATIGAWWTRLDYPVGYAPSATGWLSQDLPPSLQPWRDLDPNATPVLMPSGEAVR